jgi:hypothetical protein
MTGTMLSSRLSQPPFPFGFVGFGNRISLCSVAQRGLEPAILLPLPPECWGHGRRAHRHGHPHPGSRRLPFVWREDLTVLPGLLGETLPVYGFAAEATLVLP